MPIILKNKYFVLVRFYYSKTYGWKGDVFRFHKFAFRWLYNKEKK